jgi:hypothetical protein
VNVARLIAEWQELREHLATVERAEHPDLVDHHGRTWAWVSGDLYRHCGMAWPAAVVTDGQHSLPTASVRTNPNYQLCAICREA